MVALYHTGFDQSEFHLSQNSQSETKELAKWWCHGSNADVLDLWNLLTTTRHFHSCFKAEFIA